MPQSLTPKAYWQEKIKDYPTLSKNWLEGFGIVNDGSTSQTSYQSIVIPLNTTLVSKLTDFTNQQNLPILTLLHGAWGLLLSRFSGADDIVYGSANSHIVLPMRATVQTEETVFSYLQSTENELQSNLIHMESYEREFANTDAAKNLFNYIIFNSTDKETIKNESQTLFDREIYPLLLFIKNREPLQLELWVNPQKFSEESAQNLIEHFIVILNKFVNEPDQLVAHISILTVAEKQILLSDWNQPLCKKMPDCVKANICELFSEHAKTKPNHPAVVCEGKTVTYHELESLSNQIAQLLIFKKVHPGDPIVVIMERSSVLIATMLAIFKAGAIFIPINPKYPDEKIQFIIEDSNTHIILANNINRIPKEFFYKTVVLDEAHTEIVNLPTIAPQIHAINDAVAYVIYTSGTTGQPKGVLIKHNSLVNLVHWYESCYEMTTNDHVSQFASQGFDTFFCETIPTLSLGACVHIVDWHLRVFFLGL